MFHVFMKRSLNLLPSNFGYLINTWTTTIKIKLWKRVEDAVAKGQVWNQFKGIFKFPKETWCLLFRTSYILDEEKVHVHLLLVPRFCARPECPSAEVLWFLTCLRCEMFWFFPTTAPCVQWNWTSSAIRRWNMNENKSFESEVVFTLPFNRASVASVTFRYIPFRLRLLWIIHLCLFTPSVRLLPTGHWQTVLLHSGGVSFPALSRYP